MTPIGYRDGQGRSLDPADYPKPHYHTDTYGGHRDQVHLNSRALDAACEAWVAGGRQGTVIAGVGFFAVSCRVQELLRSEPGLRIVGTIGADGRSHSHLDADDCNHVIYLPRGAVR